MFGKFLCKIGWHNFVVVQFAYGTPYGECLRCAKREYLREE